MIQADKAALLACDLFEAHVDPNEAQKALAYLRIHRDSAAYFMYLRTIVNDGRAVIRSNQTIGYYRELLSASERHLRDMAPHQMVETLGWAIRLLRYYRAVPDAERSRVASPVGREPFPPRARTTPPVARQQPVRSTQTIIAEPAPAGPTVPAIGATFTGKVAAVDEQAVQVNVPGFDEEKVVGIMKADVVPGGTAKYRAGNAARVEVIGVRTLKNGRTVIELKPAPKK